MMFFTVARKLTTSSKYKAPNITKTCFPHKTPVTFVLSIIKKVVLSYTDI